MKSKKNIVTIETFNETRKTPPGGTLHRNSNVLLEPIKMSKSKKYPLIEF